MHEVLMMEGMYIVQKASRSAFVPIRNLQYHVRLWGEPGPGKTPLFMVHGWMDVAASFQFVVDAFAKDRYVVAPDWRGYGLTDAGGVDNFWFPDYLADLDFLIDHFQPEGSVDLVGHSMGGNIAMLYAGVRPERIRRLVNLEGFGMAQTRPSQAPGRYAKWIDELKALNRGEMALKTYPDMAAVAQRLIKTNPRISLDKAEWLARHWAQPNAQGEWAILGDAAHKVINANLYKVEEVQEIFKRISAPTLCVIASDNSLDTWWKGKYTLNEFQERMKAVAQLQNALVQDAGHMMHHDQPQVLAELMEAFLDAPDA
jgi:pimeloyl-ACP methyl ester carboxylesterase